MAESEPAREEGSESAPHGGRSGVSVRDTALVTGCSSAVGAATARALRENGWRVYATAREGADLAALADEGCATATLDVTDFEAARSTVERVVDDTGGIDLLVNVAGYAQLGALEDVPTARVVRQFDVNVFGPHRLLRAAVPHMRAAGEGRIVTVASVGGRVPFPGGGAYCGAEHAKGAMTEALRAELAEFGVDVTLVETGPVRDGDRRADRELRALDRTEAYDGLYRLYDDTRTIGGLPAAVDPDRVGAAVLEAATCADPPARVPVGAVARYARIARLLPGRVRDAGFALLRRLTS